MMVKKTRAKLNVKAVTHFFLAATKSVSIGSTGRKAPRMTPSQMLMERYKKLKVAKEDEELDSKMTEMMSGGGGFEEALMAGGSSAGASGGSSSSGGKKRTAHSK